MEQAASGTLAQLGEKFDVAIDRSERVFESIQGGMADRLFQNLSEESRRKIGLGEKVMYKRFSVPETTKLLGISRDAIYKAEREGRLPKPDTKLSADGKQIRAGFTLEQIAEMRKVFKRQPEPLPRSIVMGVLNQKGGSQKSTTTLFFAQWLALQGYRCLVVDTDAQGSLTTWMGYKPDINIHWEDTIAPFLMQHEDRWIEMKRELDDLNDLSYAVKPTYFHGIDLIPASGALLEIDVYRNMTNSAPKRLSQRTDNDSVVISTDLLRQGLAPLRENYDIILVDGTPSMNLNTANVLAACDEVLIPCPSHMLDLASTCQFVTMMQDVTELLMRNNSNCRDMDVTVVINRYTASEASYAVEDVVRYIFEGWVLDTPVEKSDEVQRGGNQLQSIYEIPREEITNTRGHKKAVENYNAVFTEVLNRVVKRIEPVRQATRIQELMEGE